MLLVDLGCGSLPEITMPVSGASKRIEDGLRACSGITAQPHRFGGTEYRLGRREIGHVHADHLVDIPFPKKVRDVLVATGRAEPHHILPETGWVSIYLNQASDVERAIELLRYSFDIAIKIRSARSVIS
jgi:Family of unknown function (DUF5519)